MNHKSLPYWVSSRRARDGIVGKNEPFLRVMSEIEHENSHAWWYSLFLQFFLLHIFKLGSLSENEKVYGVDNVVCCKQMEDIFNDQIYLTLLMYFFSSENDMYFMCIIYNLFLHISRWLESKKTWSRWGMRWTSFIM